MLPLPKLVTRDHFGSWLLANEIFGTGVEIGTYRGDYAHLLAGQWNCRLITVDPYNWDQNPYYVDGCRTDWGDPAHPELSPEAVYQSALAKLADRPNCSILRKTSVEAAKDFADVSLSFVYIDGDHSYSAVMADIMTWWPKVQKGGVFCGHDFYNRDDELMKGGVFDAIWDAFIFAGVKPHVTQCTSWWFIKQ